MSSYGVSPDGEVSRVDKAVAVVIADQEGKRQHNRTVRLEGHVLGNVLSDGGTKKSVYLDEHVALFKPIRFGEPFNNGDYMANSTRIAQLGRMAANCRNALTWDEALTDTTRLDAADAGVRQVTGATRVDSLTALSKRYDPILTYDSSDDLRRVQKVADFRIDEEGRGERGLVDPDLPAAIERHAQ